MAPNFSPVYRNWGVMESYENHLEEAIELMQKAAKIDPNDAQIYLLWGNIYRKNGKFNDAHSKYEIAHKLTPEDPIVLNAFGQANSRLGFYKEAYELLTKSKEKVKFGSVYKFYQASINEKCYKIISDTAMPRTPDYTELKELIIHDTITIVETKRPINKVYSTISQGIGFFITGY